MDLPTIAGAVLVAGVFVFLIALSRLPGDGPGLAELFTSTTELGWPRGIQEEEPVRWRVELLEPRAQTVERPVDTARDTAPATGRDGPTHAGRRASYPMT